MLHFCLLRDCETLYAHAWVRLSEPVYILTPFSHCSPCPPAQLNLLGFPKTKCERNSWYVVKSSFDTGALTTPTCCQFGFAWYDVFLSSLFPAACPTLTHGGAVCNEVNVQKMPCYRCLLGFLPTLKWNSHKALYCNGTTHTGCLISSLISRVLVRKQLVQSMHMSHSFRVSQGNQLSFFCCRSVIATLMSSFCSSGCPGSFLCCVSEAPEYYESCSKEQFLPQIVYSLNRQGRQKVKERGCFFCFPHCR